MQTYMFCLYIFKLYDTTPSSAFHCSEKSLEPRMSMYNFKGKHPIFIVNVSMLQHWFTSFGMLLAIPGNIMLNDVLAIGL